MVRAKQSWGQRKWDNIDYKKDIDSDNVLLPINKNES